MPREQRIEYPGAYYHVMARGDRGDDIVQDVEDRRRFEQTLEEVVELGGWEVLAWTLMSNHYHLVIHTPEANLVEGMRWFQNTWTRRFNQRHRLWGHLFGGRYKAIPVEEGDYLIRLMHYVHLNPVRARMVRREDGLESYAWSSLADYLKPKRRRRRWVAVEHGLGQLRLSDRAAGRREFLAQTEEAIDWGNPEAAGAQLPEGQTLHSSLRRGWYFGAEGFRERLIELLGRDEGRISARRSRGHTGAQARDHGQAVAERIIREGGQMLGLGEADLENLKKGDWRKGLLAGLIRRRALVDNGWLAQRLHMGARNAVSRIIRQAQEHLHHNHRDRMAARKFEDHVKKF